ncbi:CaiB/BaiF CoA-transferase family protein [Mycobacterium sp. CVI_P3]|uniref:CaiB/BaiF CoA-transferase family protein n=2 Tax=Mycobacterium pinniadriaticum TaxID=2994102 RepID=A0ABT3SMS7_9MYCO|nr:CaiB/BaiF CoA-transferase family protein [Mycobacterium pinniadriaticum]MCX2940836.1 CaiB/BaiF CoA-transferase family protein [Mycobacterium pinniadriaticum]
MSGPLDNLRVVSVEQAVAAPFASRQLADLGARVFKIERPGVGDFARDYDQVVNGMASHFVWINRNKESVAIDIKNAHGREVLDRLLDSADVFIHNLAPDTSDRMGLSAAAVHARNPRIVACDISGYGAGGPLGTRRAYDLLVQAESASISVTGWPGRPAKPGIAIADIGAGMYAFSSILAGLYARERTGVGCAVSVSLFDAICEWMGYTIYYSGYSGLPHLPSGVGHPSLSPYEAFETSDGLTIVIAVQNDREWVRLVADVMHRFDLAQDASLATNNGRVARRDTVSAECARWFGNHTFAEAAARLDAAEIAYAQLNGPSELLEHPQLAARNRWRDVESPVGPIRSLLPPPVAPGWSPRMDPIPSIGEHTESVLVELGYRSEDLANLREAGVIG